MTDPFEDLGEKQARKHRRRVAAIKAEKQQNDIDTQTRLYNRGNRARLKAMLKDDAVGDRLRELINLLRKMGPASAPVLVEYVNGASWLKSADDDVRTECLSLISNAIMKLRVQHGLSPMDDALFDEPLTAYQIIRKMLFGV